MIKKSVCILSTLFLLVILLQIPAETIHAATSKCSTCGGSGYVKCTVCDGTGEVGCTFCGGTGWIEAHDMMYDDSCPECDGIGCIHCRACDAYGEVICGTCGGTGTVTMPDPKPASKKKNPIKIQTSVKTVKAAQLKKAKKTVKAVSIKKVEGTVKVKLVKSGTTAAIYKKISVASKTGAITLAKGKYKAGTYKIKLKVTAAGDSKYKKLTKTVTVKIIIK